MERTELIDLLTTLRGMGVKSVTMDTKGGVRGAEFFPPETIQAMSNASWLAQADAAAALSLEPQKVRALRRQLDSEGDPEKRIQLQEVIDHLVKEDLLYGHAV